MQALLNFFYTFFIFLSNFFCVAFFMVRLFFSPYCLLLSFFISESAAGEKKIQFSSAKYFHRIYHSLKINSRNLLLKQTTNNTREDGELDFFYNTREDGELDFFLQQVNSK